MATAPVCLALAFCLASCGEDDEETRRRQSEDDREAARRQDAEDRTDRESRDVPVRALAGGKALLVEVGDDGRPTGKAFSLREEPLELPSGGKGFRVEVESEDRGSAVRYRLRRVDTVRGVDTEEAYDFFLVPVCKRRGRWALGEEGWEWLRRRLEAKLGRSLRFDDMPGPPPAPAIGIVLRPPVHRYWEAVEQGATETARELGVEVIVRSPLEYDPARQIAVVADMVARKVTGIVLAPMDAEALAPAVEEARDAGIPTVVIDAPLESDAPISFVAPDNVAAGRMAGERLAQRLGGKGKVAALGAEPVDATRARLKGFEAAMEGHPEIAVVAAHPTGFNVSQAYKTARELLVAHGRLDGVFALHEPAAIGTTRALESKALGGKVAVVAFGASPGLVEALRVGAVDALVAHDPRRMGALGVEALADHLAGKAVPQRVDPGSQVITKANVGEERVRALLSGYGVR
ncbi:MAG: sugar ABC transporter substrate-binding protein [Candidatus Brocadiia bacterium]